MSNRLIGLAAAIAVVFISIGCNGTNSTPPATRPAEASPAPASRRLDEVVNLRGPAEITYSWSSSKGRGRVISRLNGDLQRWDTVGTSGDRPTQGDFAVDRFANGQTSGFGCSWLAVADDRTKVRADCSNNDSLSPLGGDLQVAFFLTERTDKRLAERTILGHQASCYSTRSLKEICVDADGYVLYLVTGSGAAMNTFEATTALPVLQRFEWPPDTDVERTPTKLNGDPVSASALSLPAEFHLSALP